MGVVADACRTLHRLEKRIDGMYARAELARLLEQRDELDERIAMCHEQIAKSEAVHKDGDGA